MHQPQNFAPVEAAAVSEQEAVEVAKVDYGAVYEAAK